VAVRTERFKYSKDFSVDEINRFFEDNRIDRTQIIATGVVQLSTNSMAYFVTYEDVIAPYVVGTSPSDGASNVVLSSSIIIQFSESIQAAAAADFELTKNGVPVSLAGATISTSGSVVTISGTGINEDYGASYVLTIKTSIKDANGNPMAAPYVVSWVTQASTSTQVQKAGRVTPTGPDITSGYSAISFASAMPNDAYRVPCPGFHHTAPWPTGTPFGAIPLRISNKVSGGFRINFDAPFPSGAALEWFAIWGAPS
jgi:hypothetical protein